MKKIYSIIVAVAFTSLAFGQIQYSRVKINTDHEGLERLAELGVTIDHGTHKENTFFISDFADFEIEIMQNNDFEIEILIEDVQAYYLEHRQTTQPKNVNCSNASGNQYNPTTPVNHFENNTYAGFYKYQDMLDALDSMRAQYPNLITVKTGISTFLTFEGRPIYHVKISDNPDVNESAEPKVLYSAIHHAREPLSLSQTIYYMWYLLENYATNEEVQFLVNNTEMYFVPCLNPDGYIHNEVNSPSGAGMHRKNKRNVGTSNPGVDLNRNYSYGWGTTGVSTNPNSDTYPGANAFSEPETQAMRWLNQQYNFVTASNSHTYGDLLLYPIGTTSAEFAEHHNYFDEYTEHMRMHNGYTNQKSSGLYPASGDSDDYMYKMDLGIGVKDTVFAITPEVGDAFWPPQSAIEPTCKEMLFPNLVNAHLAHKYTVVTDESPSAINAISGNFNHSAKRLGRENGAVTVSISPVSANILSVGSPINYNLSLMESQTNAISYSLDPTIQFGDEIKFVLNTEYGTWTKRDTIIKTYGQLTIQTIENASNTANWSGNWGVTSAEYVSPSTSFTDSPSGNYSNNAEKTYEYNQDIDLTNATAAQISFMAKWEIEANYDYCQFQVSTDGGQNWIGQCGIYTVEGTSASGSVQPDNEPVYEGTQSNWVKEEISLSDYLGQTIRVRFILKSDAGVQKDGFYFDDFTISYDTDSTSGISTNELGFNLMMFPNPASNKVLISTSRVVFDGKVNVIDQKGATVLMQTPLGATNQIEINTSKLKNGVYFVSIEDKNGFSSRAKLVVLR